MARPIIDRVGQRFDRLVVERIERRDGATWAVCRCDCGQSADVRMSGIVNGNHKSCGCLRRDYRRAQWLKHGESSDGRSGKLGTAEYRSWCGMIARCERPDAAHARLYRDRGITICARWRHSFAAFLADVGRKPSADHSIDRFPDNDGNYEPGNVRWATRSEQAKNRRPRARMLQ